MDDMDDERPENFHNVSNKVQKPNMQKRLDNSLPFQNLKIAQHTYTGSKRSNNGEHLMDDYMSGQKMQRITLNSSKQTKGSKKKKL